MAYYITKRVYVDGNARYATRRCDTLRQCRDLANEDNSDCLIEAETQGIVDYRIGGIWK